jgi:hypothetical protein
MSSSTANNISNTKQITTIPHVTTLQQACSIAIQEDKAIKLDYYVDSLSNSCKLVKTQDKDTILYKNNDEYTSPLQKVFQVENQNDVICVSENSIYIVSTKIISGSKK